MKPLSAVAEAALREELRRAHAVGPHGTGDILRHALEIASGAQAIGLQSGPLLETLDAPLVFRFRVAPSTPQTGYLIAGAFAEEPTPTISVPSGMRWDAPPSDPIADIRRAMELNVRPRPMEPMRYWIAGRAITQAELVELQNLWPFVHAFAWLLDLAQSVPRLFGRDKHALARFALMGLGILLDLAALAQHEEFVARAFGGTAWRGRFRLDPKRPTVPEVRPLVRSYKTNTSPAGGALHVVFDDGNVSDGAVLGCFEYAARLGDVEGMALAARLLRMSRTQRAKLATPPA